MTHMRGIAGQQNLALACPILPHLILAAATPSDCGPRGFDE